MPAYAVAALRNVTMGPELLEYIERIDSTLKPFRGRFLVHGGDLDLLEGAWTGDLIIIEFPDLPTARDWYESPAYRSILPLRIKNSTGDVVLARGVSAAHRATDILNAGK